MMFLRQYAVVTGAWAPQLQPLLFHPPSDATARTQHGRPIPGHAKRSQCCGRANYGKTRIVGGDDTRPSEYPWMVRLAWYAAWFAAWLAQ